MSAVIFLLRHGIAAEPSPKMSDAERALTADGVRMTARVGRGLAQLRVAPEVVLSSPLRRAHRDGPPGGGNREPDGDGGDLPPAGSRTQSGGRPQGFALFSARWAAPLGRSSTRPRPARVLSPHWGRWPGPCCRSRRREPPPSASAPSRRAPRPPWSGFSLLRSCAPSAASDLEAFTRRSLAAHRTATSVCDDTTLPAQRGSGDPTSQTRLPREGSRCRPLPSSLPPLFLSPQSSSPPAFLAQAKCACTRNFLSERRVSQDMQPGNRAIEMADASRWEEASILLPEQFWGSGTDPRPDPEKRLMAAVLEEAILLDPQLRRQPLDAAAKVGRGGLCVDRQR